MSLKPILLIILDGFGHRDECEFNAICQARKPYWNFLCSTYPHTIIDASEKWVGLPPAQMGNSEVGHMNIGAGRVVYQDYTRIEHAIETGEFRRNPVLNRALEIARTTKRPLHVLGLLSPGGVHSHESQIHALLDMAAEGGVQSCVHAFLDGRDTAPRSAEASLAALTTRCETLKSARIASICGRYYAMDRDQRWDRTQQGYRLIVDGSAEFRATDAVAGLRAAYERGESDEFVKATVIAPAGSAPVAVDDGDAVAFMNFRADRARQLTLALTAERFEPFARTLHPRLGYFCTLTSYGEDFAHIPAAFAPQSVRNGLGEYLSSLGLRQLRIAETEKYAHVTYFFNGGIEAPYPGEDRILVPSPKVATYDQKPEMSAYEVTDRLVEAIGSRRYHAIVCNYANADMVGHTGNLEAAKRAIEVLDECLGRVVTAMREAGGEVLVTADHGNAETMLDAGTGQPHTAHTLNLVPLLYVGRKASMETRGALQDVAPSLLAMLGVPPPPEMTGHSLIRFA
jgi:2,3-bisphosphoglycerate-independent phosphoglycerate mutase